MKTLIIIDMQNDFTNGVLGNDRCNAVVSEVVKLIESKQYDKIVLTRDTHYDNYMNTQEGHKLPVIHCINGSLGWQIRDEIIKALTNNFDEDSICYLDKPSFGSINLSNLLVENFRTDDYDEFHFCGVCTGICVISNVAIAKAAMPENKICVIENACACVTAETHNTAINAMKTFQVDII